MTNQINVRTKIECSDSNELKDLTNRKLTRVEVRTRKVHMKYKMTGIWTLTRLLFVNFRSKDQTGLAFNSYNDTGAASNM